MKRLVVFFLLFSFPLFAEINQHRDFQFWQFDSVAYPLSKRNTLYAQSEIRFGDNASVAYLGYGEVLFKHDFTKRVAIIPAYRQQWLKTKRAKPFTLAFIPFIDAMLKWEGEKISYSDRNRIEYTIQHRGTNFWLYRNQLFITTKEGFGKMKVHPFIFDEVFFMERVGFEQNRLAFGLSWPVSDHVNPRLSYIIRHKRGIVHTWEYQNILAMFLFLKF